MTIQVGDDTIVIENAAMKFGGQSPSQVVKTLNEELSGHGVRADFVNNRLTLQADDATQEITIKGEGALAMKMFGSSATIKGTGSVSARIDTDAYLPSFNFELDGRRQAIQLELKDLKTFVETGDATDLLNNVNAELKRAFGSGIEMSISGQGFELKAGHGQRFMVTGDYDTLQTIGLKHGVSNKLDLGTSLKNLNFAAELQGNRFTFKINDVEFSYDGDATLSTVLSDIEKSKAGVRVTYDRATDRFKIESKQEGLHDGDFKFEQIEGNLLSSIFGIEGSGGLTTFGVNKPIHGGNADALHEDYQFGGTFNIKVNGRNYAFVIPEKEPEEEDGEAPPYSQEEFIELLNDQFANQFGTQASGVQNVVFHVDGAGNFGIETNSRDYDIEIIAPEEGDENGLDLGFTIGEGNVVNDGNTTLQEAGIHFGGGGLRIGNEVISGAELDGLSMDELAQRMEQSMQQQGATAARVEYDDNAAAFRIVGVDVPMELVVLEGDDSENLNNLFGREAFTIGGAGNEADFKITEGTNAIISLDGREIERTSNNFTVDGLTFTLYDVTVDENGEPEDVATIQVARDTEKIYEAVDGFFDLYNETVDFLYSLYKAEPNYKDYPPLTEAERREMSDREVELWEEKSKEGLLRGDPTLERILRSMRQAMYTPTGEGVAIYDIGMSTSFHANDGNFVESSPGKLKEMIESDPEMIQDLFAGTGGIMDLLNSAVNNAVDRTGSLTRVAGRAGNDSQSTISKQIRQVDSQLESLEQTYWKEYDRYWKQFNAMEQMIQQMNVQSSWLAQQLAF